MATKMKKFHSEFLAADQADRDKAIWWHIRDMQTCRSCGTREEEWDPAQGGNRHAYGAEIYRCRGCEVRQMAEESDLSVYGKGIQVRMRKNLNPYGH